jgi:hypothetical protein
VRIRKLSRRRQLRSLLVAALDVLEANEPYLKYPYFTGEVAIALLPGWCPVCGTAIQINDEIVKVRWPDGLETWVHHKHPDRWQVLRENLESADNVIIGWIGKGRGGLADQLSVGLRRPQSRFSGQHTDYISWDEAQEKGYL